ncbi:hypothetical protein AJ88_45670 [Mesorhizobium amorphae CCBAU 01583]|nr:hypothetical protein AJ88_45670 [Mesorhizobium amorphae CCBAU 01583]
MDGPAWAGCANYVDGSTNDPAPRAKICIAGFCEKTAQAYECGNAFGGQWGYLNGFTISVKTDGTVSAAKNGFEVDISRVECSGACFTVPNRNNQ